MFEQRLTPPWYVTNGWQRLTNRLTSGYRILGFANSGMSDRMLQEEAARCLGLNENATLKDDPSPSTFIVVCIHTHSVLVPTSKNMHRMCAQMVVYETDVQEGPERHESYFSADLVTTDVRFQGLNFVNEVNSAWVQRKKHHLQSQIWHLQQADKVLPTIRAMLHEAIAHMEQSFGDDAKQETIYPHEVLRTGT